MVPSTNKLTEMRLRALAEEENRLHPILERKSAITRFVIRLRLKRRVEKELKRRFGDEYNLLKSLESGDLQDPVIH